MVDKMIEPRAELDDAMLEKALKSDFKTDKQPKSKNSNVRHLVQFSDKKIPEESKKKMLANLRPRKATILNSEAKEKQKKQEEKHNEKQEEEHEECRDEQEEHRDYTEEPEEEEKELAEEKSCRRVIFPPSVRNPEMIRNCLTLDEQDYFVDRWTAYYKEYGDDLNEANDYDQMVELMMCLVDLYRIQKRKFTKKMLIEDADLDQITHRIHNRIQTILSSLNARRKDRMQTNQHSESNLIHLLMQKSAQLRSAKDIQLENEELEEEQALREKKARGS